MVQDTNIAIVTGANRGIGLEVAHQLARMGMKVILGTREVAKGETAAQRAARGNLYRSNAHNQHLIPFLKRNEFQSIWQGQGGFCFHA